MKQSLSEADFLRWQDVFHSRFWNGKSADCRVLLANLFSNHIYLEKGAIFYTIAGSQEPSTIQKISLSKITLIDRNHRGHFAALRDRFVVIQGKQVHSFLYAQCVSGELSWVKQKILVKIGLQSRNVLTLLINTWVSRNIFQRLLNDDVIDALENENEMALGVILRPLQGVVGKDISPGVVGMYEDLRQTLASFLKYIMH